MKIGQSPGESGALRLASRATESSHCTPSIAFLAMWSLDVVKEGGTNRKGEGQAYRGMEGQTDVCVTSNPPN